MLQNWLKFWYTRHFRLPLMHRAYGALTVEETFRRIYRTKEWGDDGKPFFSGAGSRGLVTEQYCDSVIEFIRSHHVESVVDLGCGDFTVGSRIVEATRVSYTGVDVVPELIEHHRSTVRDDRTTFLCADITRDPLPSGDLCLIRQVFQHLSNEEIGKALAKLADFTWVLISEEVVSNPGSFNRDKPHGPDVRGFYGSGVYVEHPPFSIPTRELWKFPLTPFSLLRTVVVDQSGLDGIIAQPLEIS